ncbi:MAG: anaerobic ribonucleoside-triphosphate reductase activating protein [Oscillospiraceae bacterium]
MVRIAGAIRESIVDGSGLRFTLFTQGCVHNCKGCHNKQTHDLNGGYLSTQEKIINEFNKNPLLAGITFSGGEPILQAEELIPIAKAVCDTGRNCWIYSGYTFDELIKMENSAVKELLSYCDFLVDGKYVEELRDLTLTFRGSKNQRIINLKKSLENGIAYVEEM